MALCLARSEYSISRSGGCLGPPTLPVWRPPCVVLSSTVGLLPSTHVGSRAPFRVEGLTSGQKELWGNSHMAENTLFAFPIFIFLPTWNSDTMAGDQAATLDHEDTLRIEAESWKEPGSLWPWCYQGSPVLPTSSFFLIRDK